MPRALPSPQRTFVVRFEVDLQTSDRATARGAGGEMGHHIWLHLHLNVQLTLLLAPALSLGPGGVGAQA